MSRKGCGKIAPSGWGWARSRTSCVKIAAKNTLIKIVVVVVVVCFWGRGNKKTNN
jgi:hypothetical protein